MYFDIAFQGGEMIGQWIGTYSGDVVGGIILYIEKNDSGYEVLAYICPKKSEIPSSIAYFSAEDLASNNTYLADVSPIDPRNYNIVPWESIKNLYDKDISHSKKADVSMTIDGDRMKISAKTDIDVNLTAELSLQKVTEKSLIQSSEMSWEQYKKHVSEILDDQMVFRGQKQPWPLQTSFHRRGRYRTDLFISKDIPILHQRLCSITSHYFNLDDPKQNGAFFNLLQHHGYPTPLLDWSYSPFVAAFFAFREWVKGHENNDECIRIYIFNNKLWRQRLSQINYLNPPFPHLSATDFAAINNPRVIPQQALTTVTNVVNIEAYILSVEKSNGVKFLHAIDIPVKYRDEAMRELRYMGITAGSMFPGIDGVCEEMKDRFF